MATAPLKAAQSVATNATKRAAKNAATNLATNAATNLATNAAAINADLHAHSTVSDGTLAPRAVVRRAAENGVELFALTDHDQLDGLADAADEARALGLPFVCGVEVSVTFAGHTVHILGLGIDPNDSALRARLQGVRSGRLRRAEAMAEGLAAAGVLGAHTAHDALQGALNYAGGADVISRTHFARWLVEIGVCSNTREVFNKYLVQGKPGYVPHQWAHLGEAVQWIGAAGGVAAIAHPGRYRYTDNELWALCTEFKAAGGIALEVATSNHDAGAVRRFAAMARDFGFEASRGSDFHGPAESHAELGRVAALPAGLVPVWHRFV